MTTVSKILATITRAAIGELPDGYSPELPTDASYFRALLGKARELGYAVIIDTPPDSGAEGMTHTIEKRIWLRPDKAAVPSRAWRLLAHELVHALLNTGPEDTWKAVPTLCAIVADEAGDTDYDPAHPLSKLKAMSFAADHPDIIRQLASRYEEWTVELTLAVLSERLGIDYRFAAHYLLGYGITPKWIDALMMRAEGLADQLMAALTQQEERVAA